MTIVINGKTETLADNLTLREVIERCQYNPARVLAAVNGNVLAKSEYAAITIKDNDNIELLSFVPGG